MIPPDTMTPLQTEAAVPLVQGRESHDYIVSGLRVRSSVVLTSAVAAPDAEGEPDVTITLGEVPETLPTAERGAADWQANGDVFLLHIAGVLRALITGGRTIHAQVDPDERAEDVGLFLLGTCFAVILQQRGRVVLHASAVSVGEYAMLFCGQSGAGKSTMAALLAKRGYPLLNDDVCNLTGRAGEYVVYPDGRMMKLWAASMQHLALSGDPAARVRHNVEKFYAAPEHAEAEPRRVGGVYVLSAGDQGSEPSLTRLNPAESMAELLQNAYRPGLVRAMQMTPAYFHASAAIQRQAGVFRLSRPMDFRHADAVLDLLEQHWATARG